MIELTTIIDGKALAGEVEAETLQRAKKLAEKGIVPGLATVLVGENPASQMYIRLKHSACSRAGIRSENVLLPESSTEEEIIAKIQQLNQREDINGILLQLPLPWRTEPSEGDDEHSAGEGCGWISSPEYGSTAAGSREAGALHASGDHLCPGEA